MKTKIKAAIRLLEGNGYTVKQPQEFKETEYWKAIRTGKKPPVWPPLIMTRDELEHFRACVTLGRATRAD